MGRMTEKLYFDSLEEKENVLSSLASRLALRLSSLILMITVGSFSEGKAAAAKG
jgi:hypothetical protein